MKKISELDEAIVLTTRRTWAMLLALVLVLGAAVSWSLLARIESTVSLPGVLLAGDGPALVTVPLTVTRPAPVAADPVVAASTGKAASAADKAAAPAALTAVTVTPTAVTVTAIAARPGHPVRAGDTLFTLDVGGVSTPVPSPVDGAVSGVKVAVGAQVAPGALLATVDHVGAPLHAVLLLDVSAGANVPVGTKVRGTGWTGAVTSIEPYPITVAALATRFGTATLPGADAAALVRPVLVSVDAAAWPGATLTPVQAKLIMGSEHPADLLLHGGF